MYPEILLKREKGSLWEVCDLREGGRNRERERKARMEEGRGNLLMPGVHVYMPRPVSLFFFFVYMFYMPIVT